MHLKITSEIKVKKAILIPGKVDLGRRNDKDN
jgi:hypothetical protein